MANGVRRISRVRGGYQLPLALVFALAVALVLIGKAQSSLFDSARVRVSDWMAPALETVHRPLDAVSDWWHGLGEGYAVYEENRRLKEENARLRQWQTAAVMLDARVKRYQLLLHAVPDPALASVLAHVIGRASRPFLETMILDAGKANNVKPGQAVIDSHGMIGRVFLAGQHTAWVILLSDLNSRIPVTIEPSHASAMLAGDNQKAPVLDTLGQITTVQAGDQVVSSGDGGLLPPGLRIGTVIADGNGFRVSLLADPALSQDVEIVDFKRPVEAAPPATPNDLPVTAAGLPPAVAPVATAAAVPVTVTTPPQAAASTAPHRPPAEKHVQPKPQPAAAPPAATAPSDGDDAAEER